MNLNLLFSKESSNRVYDRKDIDYFVVSIKSIKFFVRYPRRIIYARYLYMIYFLFLLFFHARTMIELSRRKHRKYLPKRYRRPKPYFCTLHISRTCEFMFESTLTAKDYTAALRRKRKKDG